jgi:hypothetical protein
MVSSGLLIPLTLRSPVKRILTIPKSRMMTALRRAARKQYARVSDNIVIDVLNTHRLYVSRFRRFPNLICPKTFNEKILRKRYFDRRPYVKMTADKVAVRRHIAAIVGEQFLVPLHHVVSRADALHFQTYPDIFVLKPSHGSGRVLFVNKRQSPDYTAIRRQADQWLRDRFSHIYRGVPPRIVVEQSLLDSEGQPPKDFKFFVFHGEPRLVQVDSDRYLNHRRSIYSPDWQKLSITYKFPPGPDVPRPKNLQTMLQLAGALGTGTDFIRVDMYNTEDKIFVGELTNCPSGGKRPFNPAHMDSALGELWQQPRRYSRYLPS